LTQGKNFDALNHAPTHSAAVRPGTVSPSVRTAGGRVVAVELALAQ
jgi:hypothetical protein